jgi:hypothetical protein
MRLLALYLLALLDGLLCGARVSMGRCALIHKRPYYARALLRGLFAAQVISMIALAALLAVSAVSSHRAELRAELEAAATRMLWVFVPYAVAVVGSLGLRVFPSTDLRSATSVFALGPFTAIRPVVMIAGVFYGIAASRLLETRLLGLFVLILMLSLEYFLNRSAGRRQRLEIRQLV